MGLSSGPPEDSGSTSVLVSGVLGPDTGPDTSATALEDSPEEKVVLDYRRALAVKPEPEKVEPEEDTFTELGILLGLPFLSIGSRSR